MKIFITLLVLCIGAYGAVAKIDGRIVGGKEADIRDFPFQVSVRVNDQHSCGGSILSPTTILTAAHCVHNLKNVRLTIRAGSTNNTNGDEYVVRETREHEFYSPITQDNDVAILKLASGLNFSESVQPVDLQPGNLEVPTGSRAIVSGWGLTKEGGLTAPDMLRYAELSIVDQRTCNKLNSGKVTDSMICAYAVGKDSCQMDSGGPLVVDGKLVGVVSWGFGCARPNRPGVYAKVSELHHWIDQNAY